MKRIRKDQIKTLGVVALMIGAYVLFVYLPGGRQQKALQQQVEQDQQKLAQVQETDLDALRAQAAEEREKLEAVQRDLPAEREVFLVLDGVSGSLLDESIHDHQLSQSDPRPYKDYTVQPIDLDFSAGFTETFTAIQAIEQLPFPVQIDRLELVGSADDADGRVHTSAHLSAFYEPGASHE